MRFIWVCSRWAVRGSGSGFSTACATGAHRQHARAHRAARPGGQHPEGRDRDLHRGPERPRRPPRAQGGMGAEGRPVAPRPRAHALRAARHRGQGGPADGPLRHGLHPLGDGRRPALQQDPDPQQLRHAEARQVRHAVLRFRRLRRPRGGVAEPGVRRRRRGAEAAEDRGHRHEQVPGDALHLRWARARWRRSAACRRCCSSSGSSATATSARSRAASRTPSPTSSWPARSASTASCCSTR